jgi:hypothetical protein
METARWPRPGAVPHGLLLARFAFALAALLALGVITAVDVCAASNICSALFPWPLLPRLPVCRPHDEVTAIVLPPGRRRRNRTPGRRVVERRAWGAGAVSYDTV